MRWVRSLITDTATDNYIVNDTNTCFYDTEDVNSQEPSSVEIPDMICMPCYVNGEVNSVAVHATHCCRPFSASQRIDGQRQGEHHFIGSGSLTDLCSTPALTAGDVLTTEQCGGHTETLPDSSLTTVVAGSLRLENDSRDPDCLLMETQLEAQACDKLRGCGTDCSSALVNACGPMDLEPPTICVHAWCGCPADPDRGDGLCSECDSLHNEVDLCYHCWDWCDLYPPPITSIHAPSGSALQGSDCLFDSLSAALSGMDLPERFRGIDWDMEEVSSAFYGHTLLNTRPGVEVTQACSHQFCGCPVSDADVSRGRTMCRSCSDMSWEEGGQSDCEHCAQGCSFCDWLDRQPANLPTVDGHTHDLMTSYRPDVKSNNVRASNWSRLVLAVLLMWLNITDAASNYTTRCNRSVSWADPLTTVCSQTARTSVTDSHEVNRENETASDDTPANSDDLSSMSETAHTHSPNYESPDSKVMVSASSTDMSNSALTDMSEGAGAAWLPDTVSADHMSLFQRISSALPGVEEKGSEPVGSSTSNDWFHGKMSPEWFDKHLVQIDHADDRFRRDWSTKDSEKLKGPNRFAKQWQEYMAGMEYSTPEDLPYTPACNFGKNLSQSCDFERQRLLLLAYCEFLKCYSEVWTKLHSRHPVAGVLFSGAGIMVRGFLWMGVRCIMVDYEAQKDAPTGDDCLFVQSDVKLVDAKQLEVDWIQASPPCPPSSTAPNMGGTGSKSKHEQLIPFFQNMMIDLNAHRSESGLDEMKYVLENVASSGHLMRQSMLTDGQQIGSRVNRKRMLEANCYRV